MARRMFLSETAPAMVLGEVPPGPGWREARRVDQPSGKTISISRPSSEPTQLSLSDMVNALAAAMGPARPLQTSGVPDDDQQAFHQLAERTAKVLNISLADAYSRVATEAPIIAERARKAAML